MGTVDLARDVRHDRKVALKVFRPEVGAAVGAERFLREIRLVASLAYPHILPLFDSGEGGDYLYHVTPTSRVSRSGTGSGVKVRFPFRTRSESSTPWPPPTPGGSSPGT